jgi:hypothetical protein
MKAESIEDIEENINMFLFRLLSILSMNDTRSDLASAEATMSNIMSVIREGFTKLIKKLSSFIKPTNKKRHKSPKNSTEGLNTFL